MHPIVHIGYHKTATTWFQREVYPRAVSHRWIPRDVVRKALLDPVGLNFDVDEARRQLSDSNDQRPAVICEENLSGYIHNGGLHGLMAPEVARRIKLLYPDARIVILIRAQPAMIAATYIQYVRGGGTFGPRRYLLFGRYLLGAPRHAYKSPRFEFEHFEYDRLIAFYDELFGRENVIVLPHEELRRDEHTFLSRMKAELGLQLDPAFAGHESVNRSFGRFTILAGRFLGLFTARSVVDKTYLLNIPGLYELRRPILNALARFDPPGAPEKILGRPLTEYVQTRYAASNRRLAQLRDIDLAGLGYPMGPAQESC